MRRRAGYVKPKPYPCKSCGKTLRWVVGKGWNCSVCGPVWK